jgi:transcription initiation factor TFIIF subunit beta
MKAENVPGPSLSQGDFKMEVDDDEEDDDDDDEEDDDMEEVS